MRKTLIAPSILAADFGQFAAEAKRTELAGADWLHCDVMDGNFVPNITFGPDIVAALRKATKLPLDVHLMIARPDLYAERFLDAGADNLIVHVEAQYDVAKTLAVIRSRGKRAGLSLNPPTPVAQIFPFLDQVTEVLVMTVNPGFGGQAFIPEMLEKIRELRRRAPQLDISVDGGINPETGRRCVEAGANALVAGNALYRHKTLMLPDAIQELRTYVEH
ncbi:MAG: ribulose-phosphate 3-epimerase [Verrucomicrobiota bacterium]